MRRAEQRRSLRMLKLRDVLSHWNSGELSQLEAAKLSGTSERRRGAHRRKRPRRPMVGMMLHQDGSTHAWLSGLGPLDLVDAANRYIREVYLLAHRFGGGAPSRGA